MLKQLAGLFITFEGIEGCGKSTQVGLLAAALGAAGHRVVRTREPGGTAIGDAIRTILLNPVFSNLQPTTELLLYAASRAQHVAEIIRPALARGDVVISDRFTDSTHVYQGAARRIDQQHVEALRALATGGLTPNLTVLLDISVAVSAQRLATRGSTKDRLEQESRPFHEAVRQGYLALAASEPARFLVLDGTLAVDELHAKIAEQIKKVVGKDIGTLDLGHRDKK